MTPCVLLVPEHDEDPVPNWTTTLDTEKYYNYSGQYTREITTIFLASERRIDKR